eukprot:10136251-Ditylum_brightwellii.AAC.1
MSKKRQSDVPQVPNPHPFTRIEPGTDADVDASIGLQASDEINNGEDAIADLNSIVPESNEDGGIVEPGNNDPGSEDSDDTTPPATPELVKQQKLQNKKEDTNNKPPSSITVKDPPECFDES